MGDRHAFRARWHDYNEGIYFITICSYNKSHIFGKIENENFYPSELGKTVIKHIRLLPTYYHDVELFNHVVMPNHIHLLLAVGTRLIASANSNDSGTDNLGCLKSSMHGDMTSDFHHNSRLATIIGAFKAGVTRTARTQLIVPLPYWQSRYYENIIRNQGSFDMIMAYIDNNIANWNNDCFY